MTATTDRWADLLPARWREDPFLLTERTRCHLRTAWTSGDGLLLSTVRDGRLTLVGHGAAAEVAALVARLAGGSEGSPGAEVPGWLTVPRAAAPLVAADAARWGLTRTAAWDWWLTTTAPPRVTGEERVGPLDPVRDAAGIRGCLATANPGTEADPEDPDAAGWWGVEAGGELVAVIGGVRRGGRPGGPPSVHLEGLGVLPGHRRAGLGAALTAAAVRAALAAGAPWVSLGMYADNEDARRVYDRLGLRVHAERTSFRPA